MKKMEVMQMERIAGGVNSFWTGVGCGLVIGGGAILGGLTGAGTGAALGGPVGAGVGGVLGFGGGIAAGIGTCILSI